MSILKAKTGLALSSTLDRDNGAATPSPFCSCCGRASFCPRGGTSLVWSNLLSATRSENLEADLNVNFFTAPLAGTWLTRAGTRFYADVKRILTDVRGNNSVRQKGVRSGRIASD